MKKLLSLIGVASLATVINCSSQTVTNASGGTTTVTNASGWQPILNVYNDIRNASNIAVAPFGVALLSGEKKGTFGGGVLALYNVNNYVGIGLGTYWLGAWYEFNGSVQLQYPLQLWGGVVLTPFVVAGIGTSFSGSGGANGDVTVVSQLGANLDLFSLGKGWEVGLGGFYGNISGASKYSGNDAGGFLKFSRGF